MKFDIKKIQKKLLIKYPYFGSIIANAKYISDDNIKTAATDGKNIFFNESYMNTINISQQVFVLAHELSHIAFNHIPNGAGKVEKIWNIACDAVINANLIKDRLSIPNNAINMPDAISYDSFEYYDILMKKFLKNKNSPDGPSNHKKWSDDKTHSSDDVDSKMNEKKIFDDNRRMKDENLKNLQKSLVSESIKDKNDEISSSFGTQNPFTSWQRLLKTTTDHEVDWSYRDSVIEDGVVLPLLVSEQKANTEIILDTSGSIDTELLKYFLRECKNIFKFSRIKVGCFDNWFYGFHDIVTMDDIDNFNFTGGGGTNFDAAVAAFSRNCDNKIIFTDGLGLEPLKSCDAIWIVFRSVDFKPLGGSVIYIPNSKISEVNKVLKK